MRIWGDAVPSRDAVRALVEAARKWAEYTKPIRGEWGSEAAFQDAVAQFNRLTAALAAFPAQPESKP